MQEKIGASVGAITSVLGTLVLLGIINLTADQIAGIGVAVGAVLMAVAGWFSPKVPIGPTE